MSEAQTLIDDIAAEYPDLRDHEDEQPFHHGIPGDEDAQGEAEGEGGQPGDMSGLTDEALRQFANAAAMHYELGREGETPSHGKEGQGADEEDAVEGLASGDAYGGNGSELGEPGQVVVSGSIPPPPRPTYETTHPTHRRIDPQEMATLQDPTSAAAKRKRSSDEATFEQPLQAQGPPRGKKQHRMDAVDTGMIDPSIANSPDAATNVLSPRDLAQANIYNNTASSSRIPPALVIAPQPPHQAHAAARGRKPSARHDEMMTMGMTADPAAEGSDAGRKENKDERSARRAEQNRRAQQNFRKRREETMKQQEARLKELEPQLEALQRQQAETQLLLEALKLENTALRAVLIHSVKQGARILDAQGELIGSATAIGLVDPTTEDDVQSQAQPDLEGTETEKHVNDVYAALDRLGARTHVYARTIVPVATEDPTFSSAPRHPESNPALLGGVAQSSMRTVPHASHPHAGSSSIAQQRDTPHAFPTTNLPPFPSGPQSHPQQQPQVEEPSSSAVGQIDPTLGGNGHSEHVGDDSLMMVDAETGLALPE